MTRPSFAPELAQAHATLLALAARADWAYGLAFDRSAPPIQPGQSSGTSHGRPIPVKVAYDEQRRESISSAADQPWADAYTAAAKQLTTADVTLARAIRLAGSAHWSLTIIEPNTDPVTAPAYLARLCHHIAHGLHIAAPLLPLTTHRARRLVTSTVIRHIQRADELIPDNRTPPRPPECRNPDNRERCHSLPLYDKARRLCEYCYRHDQYKKSRAET